MFIYFQAIGRMEDLLDHFLDREQTDSTFTENELNGNFAMNEPLEMSSDSDDSDDSNATEIEEGEVEGNRLRPQINYFVSHLVTI